MVLAIDIKIVDAWSVCSDRVYERDGSYQARYLEGLEAIGFATVILGATAVLVSMAPNRAHPVD